MCADQSQLASCSGQYLLNGQKSDCRLEVLVPKSAGDKVVVEARECRFETPSGNSLNIGELRLSLLEQRERIAPGQVCTLIISTLNIFLFSSLTSTFTIVIYSKVLNVCQRILPVYVYEFYEILTSYSSYTSTTIVYIYIYIYIYISGSNVPADCIITKYILKVIYVYSRGNRK